MSKARKARRVVSAPSSSRVPVAPARLERLEERVFLSADLGAQAMINWGGREVSVLAGSYIVTLDSHMTSDQAELVAREAATRLGVSASSFEIIGEGRWITFTTNDYVSKEAASRVSGDMGRVLAIEPNVVRQLAATPNDPSLSQQWGLINSGQQIPPGAGPLGTAGADISAAEAWDVTIGDPTAVVAVIDSGIDLTHADLAANIWVNTGEIAGNGIDDDGNGVIDDINGFDFGTNSPNVTDTTGHGTGVAGVIAAVGNNGAGITGVSWNTKILPVKVTGLGGQNFTASAVIAAQNYITRLKQRGVNIVAANGSYADISQDAYANGPLQAEITAITELNNAGVLFVTSAGNQGLDLDDGNTFFPASYQLPGVISVAATDNNDALAAFSNIGAQTVDLGAPGVGIFTTGLSGSFNFVNGTSFSSAYVAGAAALLKAVAPTASPTQLKQAILNGVDALPALQGRTISGGRLNVARSIEIISIAGPVLTAANPGPVTGQNDPTTNLPINTITLEFSKPIDNNPSFFNTGGVSVIGRGTDGVFGGVDVTIPVTGIAVDAGDARRVVISLNLATFAGSRLPLDTYRVTLASSAIRDTDGNFLNGNTVSGQDEVHEFRVIAPTGDNELNDTLATATSVSFDSNGNASFNGATIGNGFFANLDVDLYMLTLARGGEITAETIAARRSIPSNLDTVIRLFNSRGEQIASNDQFFGTDSFIDFFVASGGTYYIGVSGFGNAAYNPDVGGSGTTQSLGVYDLRLNVRLSQDEVVNYAPPASALPRRIPVAENQTQGTTTSTIAVTDSRSILDLNVRLNLTHSFISDLTISLIGPDNTEVVLFNRRGGSTANITSIVLDDEASTLIQNYRITGVTSYRPDNALSAFDGKVANGNWTLKIVDSIPLNSGNLIDWSIDFTFGNNIFGPFEFNDTITTAKPVTEIAGIGTAARDAFLGDGAFGASDRDMFAITVDPGTSLNVIATSLGQANTALRLFDSSGTQLALSSPSTSNNSNIENYIFTSGGTYYIAVSESGNTTYNPLNTSDNATNTGATTGNYRLSITVTAGVGDPGTVLDGTLINVGVGTDGTLNAADSNGNTVGLQFGTTPLEFLTGNVQTFISAGSSAGSFFNNGPGGTTQLPFSLISTSDEFNNALTATGIYRGLRVQRTLSFADGDSFIAIDIVLSNIGTSSLTGVGWLEGFNPNPGQSTADNTPNTAIDVDGRYIRATFTNNTFQQGLTVALGAPAADTRASVNVVNASTTLRDPNQFFALPASDPEGTSLDGQLAIGFNVGTLDAGASTRLRYFIFMGNDPASTASMYGQVNNGSGSGHLTATVTNNAGNIIVTSDNPAPEALQTGGSLVTVPTLPYSLYYPEGFSGPNITTTLSLVNPSAAATRVVVIARFETGVRDQLIFDSTLTAGQRTSLELLSPASFAASTAIINRNNAPYALEIRSEKPISTTFTHVDGNLTGGAVRTAGESFTSRTSASWTFPEVAKGGANRDFILLFNPTDTTQTVTLTFVPKSGGASITVPIAVEAHRRGGMAINDRYFDQNSVSQLLPDGVYAVSVVAASPIVASVSRYDAAGQRAEAALGNVGLGSTSGVNPDGQFGLNATAETVSVFNAGATTSTVTFTFIFANGSADRRLLSVPARSVRELNLATLSGFPTGQAYSMTYTATAPVSVMTPSQAFSNTVLGSTADRAYTYWTFGDGFRPGGNVRLVNEYLRVFNPSNADVTIEITINYAGTPGSEVFRRTVNSRRVAEFNVDDFITGTRRNADAFYGITIKASKPIVASYGRADLVTGNAFSTLGTPLGISGAVL
ncbi:MAG: sensory rhodopsin transducer [Phycisphaerales bacterium]